MIENKWMVYVLAEDEAVFEVVCAPENLLAAMRMLRSDGSVVIK